MDWRNLAVRLGLDPFGCPGNGSTGQANPFKVKAFPKLFARQRNRKDNLDYKDAFAKFAAKKESDFCLVYVSSLDLLKRHSACVIRLNNRIKMLYKKAFQNLLTTQHFTMKIFKKKRQEKTNRFFFPLKKKKDELNSVHRLLVQKPDLWTEWWNIAALTSNIQYSNHPRTEVLSANVLFLLIEL